MTEPTVMHATGPSPEMQAHIDKIDRRHAVELEALRDFTDGNAGNPGCITLGDLVTRAVSGRSWLYQDGDGHPECWDTVERAVIEQTALELKALNHALASELTTDDCDAEPFTRADACGMLKGIINRLDAAAELCHRLRAARWGHPNFGGGETWLERQQGNGAHDAEGSES